jgi:putative transposase
MPQSLSTVYVHLVFSTKDRQTFLDPAALRDEMHAYLGGVSAKLDSPALLVGGTNDHVHALCRLGRTVSQSDLVKEIKRASSIWIKERDASLRDFAWQSGFGIFSVSASNVEAVRTYIAKQEEHHRFRSFQDEYREFLRKHGMEWDERYVWD